jgi:tRNA-dihydrouridine synthase 2
MIPGKEKAYAAMNKSKCYTDVIKALGLENVDDLLQQANTVDEHLGIPMNESRASKRARVKEAQKTDEDTQKTEKRKERDEEEPEAKRVKVPEVEPEAAMALPPQEMTAPAALSV